MTTSPSSDAQPHAYRLLSSSVTPATSPRLVGSMKQLGNFRHLTGYATWMRAWGAAASTIHARLAAIESALGIWGDPLTVTRPAISGWLGNPDFSPWTRVTYFNHARSFFSYLVETGLRSEDPTLGMRSPARPRNAPNPLSAMEMVRLEQHLSGRVTVWLLLARRQGFRAHEIAKIRGEDVREDVTFVLGKGSKPAYLPTHPEVWRVAQEEFPARGFWFPPRSGASHAHVTRESVTVMTGRAFRAAQVSGSIHRGRHTFATELLRAGVNIRIVQKLMRHSSLATTEMYLDVSGDELRAAINSLAA